MANIQKTTETQVDSEMDNHIIGSIREGRKPGIEDAKYFEENYLISSELFLQRVEILIEIYKDEFGINQKPVIEKVIFHLNKSGIKRNVVTGKLESEKGQVLMDDLYIQLIRKNLRLPKEDLKALTCSHAISWFHPLAVYLAGLENMPFDTELNYFGKVGKYVKTDNPEYFAVMLKKHLIRAIDQFKRGVPNRYVIVLYSSQQLIGKSIFIKWLNPLPEAYYSEQPLRGDKDGEIMLSTIFIFSIEELDGMSKKEVSKIKSFISRAVVNERKPYASEATAMPRLATIFASTNDREFLTDTSNTRWIIFDVKGIDHGYNNLRTGEKAIDINSLWWQALREWKLNNSAGMLTAQECTIQEKTNGNYNVATPEFHLILKHIREPKEKDKPKEKNNQTGQLEGEIEFLSATDILIRLSSKYPAIRINSTWLGREMKRAGFESVVCKVNGRSLRGYKIVWSDESFTNIEDNDPPF